jgi:hypothetical protein
MIAILMAQVIKIRQWFFTSRQDAFPLAAGYPHNKKVLILMVWKANRRNVTKRTLPRWGLSGFVWSEIYA